MSKRKSEELDPTTLSILLASLQSVQSAIREYDTKAQIISIAFIFALGLISTIGSLAPNRTEFTVPLVIFSWLFGVIPVVMFGYVLYPSRSMAPKLGTKIETLQRSFYILDSRFPTLDNFIEAFDRSDWKLELSYEIQKSSLLRDIKRKRFVWALFIAGISFALMFLAQLLRAVGIVG